MKEKNEDRFSVFIPIELEKATGNTADKYHNMRIKGIASTIHSGRDSDGELLEVDGMDVTELVNSGFLNYHHLQTKDPSAIVGEPTKAEIKDGNLYIEGRLYPDSQKARDIYDLGEILEKNSENRRLGFSIEGKALTRNPKDKKHILKSRIVGCAITPMPKNKGTKMEIMKGWTQEIPFEILKAETDEQGNTVEYLIDTVGANGVRRTVDKNLHIKVWSDDLNKAMEAGNVTGRDTTNQNLTQQPLKEESVEGTKKKKKKKDNEESMSKGETIISLMKEGYSAEGALGIWEIACEIRKLSTEKPE